MTVEAICSYRFELNVAATSGSVQNYLALFRWRSSNQSASGRVLFIVKAIQKTVWGRL